MSPPASPPEAGAWSLLQASVRDLRYRKAAQAYREQDLVSAVLEAEELLQEDPDHQGTLEILGDAELELGHGREALLVFEKLHEMEPARADYLGGLAVARFLHADFEGTVEAAREALRLDPGLAEAEAYLGLALERLGHRKEGRRHLLRASRLDPVSYPLPVPEHRVPWKALHARVMARIPPSLGWFFQRVPLVYQEFPDPAVLRSVDPPIHPLVLALYEGHPPPPESQRDTDEPILPRSIRIYKGNVRRFAHDPDRLVDDLLHALVSEAVDWLGLPMPEELEAGLRGEE